MSEIPLGKQTAYPTAYDPGLLFPVPRAANRSNIGIAEGAALPFAGFDHWRAYELSWLSPTGQPVVALADILVPCDSPCLIESKSMKLYFNSLNQHVFTDAESARQRIGQDLAEVAGAAVQVTLYTSEAQAVHTVDMADAVLLDELTVTTSVYQPSPQLLTCHSGTDVNEILYSHLFRSNCPITAQPDWGSIVISYQGEQIDHRSLLSYLISYRLHEGFHEHCVEQIFQDLSVQCRPRKLQVSINFLRRGGLEINPLRCSSGAIVAYPLPRLLRQ
ncbi:NADPH-dependent 7-cyano-7-deazaguanine reductase QueF [Pseudohongiella sp.]|nr:NADPH-dependent 7-cyano-7-deazaguanine reductase QueF [Pseudohongiella sp.]HDZ08583.1 NADPH-dependent 7-cyano-7-deazaguanine reductase QueF [Pseudohongiella sp.]HEA61679.1 NADPH-dependent 7-cyano-7-deazaguanine reductase QueF [Pseudohongiella sp.]